MTEEIVDVQVKFEGYQPWYTRMGIERLYKQMTKTRTKIAPELGLEMVSRTIIGDVAAQSRKPEGVSITFKVTGDMEEFGQVLEEVRGAKVDWWKEVSAWKMEKI